MGFGGQGSKVPSKAEAPKQQGLEELRQLLRGLVELILGRV